MTPTHKDDKEWTGEERRRGLDIQTTELSLIKKIVGGVGGVLVLQLFGAIWWAATMTTSMEYLKQDLSAVKASIIASADERYRATDARKDFADVDRRIVALQAQVNQNTDKIYEIGQKSK